MPAFQHEDVEPAELPFGVADDPARTPPDLADPRRS
jgi:hypothetical protein